MASASDFDFTDHIQGVAHDNRWEILKPELELLFHTHQKYEDIARHMKMKYGFDAQVPAYKYRFNKKWNWRRSIPASKKEEILDHTHQRALIRKRTAVTFGNTPVDAKKLKRHMACASRAAPTLMSFRNLPDVQTRVIGTFLPFGVRPFALWSVPINGTLRRQREHPISPRSPISHTFSANDLHFSTPPGTHPSPGGVSPGATPTDAPSPFSAAVIAHASRNRANLFLEGRFSDLLKSMSQSETRTFSNWLYQFWLFGFKTAKHWGTNQMIWDAEALGLWSTELRSISNSPFDSSPSAVVTDDDHGNRVQIQPPSELCRWSIHLDSEQLGDIPGSTQDEPIAVQPQSTIVDQLQYGLRSNLFSSIEEGAVPVAVPHLATAAANSPQVMYEEAVCFAIMAQNEDALYAFEDDDRRKYIETLSKINAMHVATSYLNGGNKCCNIMALICRALDDNVLKLHVNDHGHTVLDNLMLTILRSHSMCPIGRVDDSLKQGARYAGIEVDICGRWDADSMCFRSLIAAGETSIPRAWKHKFCGTSVQAVYHVIAILDYFGMPIMTKPSGLFQKLCTHCGLRLQLMPLHSVIMVAFELGDHASEDEDLFGMVTCFLCLLSYGANPLERANVSLESLFDIDTTDCTHQNLTPYELVQQVPTDRICAWPSKLQQGWRLLSHVCRLAESSRRDLIRLAISLDQEGTESTPSEVADEFNNPNTPYDRDGLLDQLDKIATNANLHCCSSHEGSEDLGRAMLNFSMKPALSHLWASIQAELLNYRRIDKDGLWLSASFDIAELNSRLENDDTVETGYTQRKLLKEYCGCANFTRGYLTPSREKVSTEYYSNMDAWDRTSFIETIEPW